MSKGIVSRLMLAPERARQQEREARVELGGLLEEAAITIEELLGALGNLEALVTGWLKDANSPVNNPTLVAARTAIHNVVSNRRHCDEREAALDEAVTVCLARAKKYRAEAATTLCDWGDSMLRANAVEAEACAEAIMKLNGNQT
jgi:hypothetical protein